MEMPCRVGIVELIKRKLQGRLRAQSADPENLRALAFNALYIGTSSILNTENRYWHSQITQFFITYLRYD